MRRLSTVILILILVSLFVVSIFRIRDDEFGAKEPVVASIVERGKLVVAMDVNLPGYFTFNGEPYGFQHDILALYAAHLGAELEIVPQKSTSNALNMLQRGEVDMVATMSKHASQPRYAVHILEPLYKTGYVVLTSKKRTHGVLEVDSSQLKPLVKSANVVITQSFTATNAYDYWMDSVSNKAVVSFDNSLNLISSLNDGNIDFVVCERLEGELGCQLYDNVSKLYDFNEEVSSVMFVAEKNQDLEQDFNYWLDKFKKTDEFKELHALYLESEFLDKFRSEGYIQPIAGISPYDDIIKTESQKAGRDWRLVSAIAYSESRFNPHVVSPRGAQGIMQIMPSTAVSYNVKEDIKNPKVNISLALKILAKIEKSLKFSSSTSEYDKLCIILACYNGGVGHVLDARRLAVKNGDDPNIWSNVSKYLQMKSQEDIYTDESVRSGKFSGSDETLSFVAKVMRQYDKYLHKTGR